MVLSDLWQGALCILHVHHPSSYLTFDGVVVGNNTDGIQLLVFCGDNLITEEVFRTDIDYTISLLRNNTPFMTFENVQLMHTDDPVVFNARCLELGEMIDARQSERYILYKKCTVTVMNTKQNTIATLSNISESGVAIETNLHMEIGWVVTIAFMDEYNKVPIEVQGNIVSKHENESITTFGIRLNTVDGIEQFIDAHKNSL